MRLILLAAVVALAAGPALAKAPKVTPEILAEAARPVTCDSPDDCEVKWGRALQWVLNNSAYKIQTQTDMMISTYGPEANSPLPAFTVNRVPKGGGVYEFNWRAACNNMFGCSPNLTLAKAAFVRAIMDDIH